jgi:hypothetical protein
LHLLLSLTTNRYPAAAQVASTQVSLAGITAVGGSLNNVESLGSDLQWIASLGHFCEIIQASHIKQLFSYQTMIHDVKMRSASQ